jgi:O-antigen ligase
VQVFEQSLAKSRVFFPLLPLALFLIFVSNFWLMAWLIPGYMIYDMQRIAELSLLAVTGLTLIFIPGQRRLWLSAYDQIAPWIRLVLLIVLSLGLVSSSLASVPRYAFLQMSVYFFLFVLALYISSQRLLNRERLDVILLMIIFIGMAVYEYVFVKVYYIALIQHMAYNPFPGYGNLRFLADVLSWTLPLTVLPFFMESTKRSWMLKILFFIVGSLWWMIFFVNESKGLLLVLGCVIVFLFIYYRSRVISWLAHLFLLALTGFSLWQVFFKWVSIKQAAIVHFGIAAAEGTMASRLSIWAWAWAHIKAHPFFGVGPAHCHFLGISGKGQFLGNPHNSLLEITMCLGVPVAMLLLVILLYSYFHWIKRAKTLASPKSFNAILSVTLISCLLTGTLNSMGSAVIMTPVSQVVMAVIFGWAFGYFASMREILFRTVSSWADMFFMLLSLLFLLMMGMGIYPDVFYISALEIKWSLTEGLNTPFTPGFWQKGFFGLKGF